MPISSESWRSLPGYEGMYEVSDQGHIRSVSRVISCGQRGGSRTLRGRIIRASPANPVGHLRTGLRGHDGRTHSVWVHRIVARAFIPNPDQLPYVLHGPGGPADNRVDNLRWGTAADNAADCQEFGSPFDYSARSRCRSGHDMTEANTYVPPGRPRERRCRTCMRANSSAWKRQKST
jgi:hypothetical protein